MPIATVKEVLTILVLKLPRKLFSLPSRVKWWALFRNRRVTIAGPSRIAGFQNIHIMGSFNAGKNLWLEAISKFAGEDYTPTIEIGDGFICSEFVHIGAISRIVIGTDVLIGSKTLITDHTHGKYTGDDQSSPLTPPYERPLYSKGAVCIGDRVFIGDNCVIMPGVNIGMGAVVGANSIVTSDVPTNTMVMGAPARPVKQFCFETMRWKSRVGE